MTHKGMFADFSEEDIALMQSIWLEEEKRKARAAERLSRPKRIAKSKSKLVEVTPDRKTASTDTKPGS
jgi:hypothetical protein